MYVAKKQGLTILLALQYFSLIWYFRSKCWRDPTSRFFQPQRAYSPEYSAHRIEQATEYADLIETKPRAPEGRKSPPELCVGIPSVQRNGISYLKSTLGSLQHGLTAKERASLRFVVFLAHSDQQEHEDYDQPWLANMADELPSYRDNPERFVFSNAIQLNKTHATKSKFDYSIVMEECQWTGAPYTLMVEDDVVFMDGWHHRTMQALDVATAKTWAAGHQDFLYLRLFYYEGLLGWNSEAWPKYLGSSVAMTGAVLALLILIRRYIPAARLYLTRPGCLMVAFVFTPLLIALCFTAGANCVLPQPAGVHLMPRNACCGQGFVFPQTTVTQELLPLFRDGRWSELPTDSFIEKHADATSGLRWALTPVVMQHVGGRSSHGVLRGMYGDMTPSHIFNFAFEENDVGSLATEHLQATTPTS